MRAEIRPINVRGKSLPKAVRLNESAYTGTLRIFENRLHAFGRVVTCATLTDPKDGLGRLALPELLDVQIIWLDDNGMRLRGIEQVDGVLFGQTWEIKVLHAKG